MPRKQRDNSRYYTIGNNKYPSVTTVLGVIDKPALREWALNEMSKRVNKNLTEIMESHSLLDKKAINFVVRDGKKGHQDISGAALSVGSTVHEMIQKYFNDESQELIGDEPKEVNNCMMAFWDWLRESGFQIQKSEQVVYSDSLHYAGTLDAVGRMGAKRVLIDFKTSKGIWDDYFLQVVAYKKAYEEMTEERIDQTLIVRFDKQSAKFEAQEVYNIDGHFRAFLACKEIWEWQHR